MGNEVAAALSGEHDSRKEVGADELAQGLLLVRASAIKLVRFQLAMERRDRRVALEAVDDLVVLDRKIANFLSDIPGSAESLSALERDLEEQRRALAREKFTLAAGTARRIMGEDRATADDGDADRPIAISPDGELVLAGRLEADRAGLDLATAGPAGVSSRLLAAGLMLVLLAVAVGAYLFLSGTGAALLHGALP